MTASPEPQSPTSTARDEPEARSSSRTQPSSHGVSSATWNAVATCSAVTIDSPRPEKTERAVSSTSASWRSASAASPRGVSTTFCADAASGAVPTPSSASAKTDERRPRRAPMSFGDEKEGGKS